MAITNNAGISLTLAVWLVNDNYDYIDGKNNYISATTLMRPLKQIVLAQRISQSEQNPDVEEFIARGLGNSIHDSIEKAWVDNYQRNLRKLGVPEAVITRVRVNPTDEQLHADHAANVVPIPIYLEQRAFRVFETFTIGGKFDIVAEGHVEDNKSTSAYGWVFGTRDDENRLQGSLYRWIDHQKEGGGLLRITEDFIRVNYIFTDWSKMLARTNKDYPDKRVKHKDIPLLSLEETENWVRAKLAEIKRCMTIPESQMPRCSDEELWRSDPKYKYYSDPEKAKAGGRSTKNFDALADANRHCGEQGKGVVITVPGEVKRCGFCPAYDICEQKNEYFNVNSD